MKSKSKQSRPRTTKPIPVIPLVIRRPFRDPVPLQDQLAIKFGPRTPVPANKQVPGRN
jgi:hypothetical protein